MSQPIKSVAVIGAGAVGCYVGAALAGELDVTLVGRERQRDSMEGHGLVAVPLAGDKRVASGGSFKFASELAAAAGCDAILVSVKSGQTAEIGAELAAALEAHGESRPLVVSLQNGVRNAETLREHLGDLADVAAAIVSFNVILEDGSVARQTTSGPLVIEDVSPALVELQIALEAASIETERHASIADRQWTKLVINLSNSVSALSGAPTREMIASPGYRRVIAAVTREALDVLSAASIKPAKMRGVPLRLMAFVMRLPTPIVRLATRAQMKVDPRARSSMWQDLDRRRSTEVEFLNGEIVRLAAKHDAGAPINTKLVELVHAAEQRAAGSPELSADALAAELGL